MTDNSFQSIMNKFYDILSLFSTQQFDVKTIYQDETYLYIEMPEYPAFQKLIQCAHEHFKTLHEKNTSDNIYTLTDFLLQECRITLEIDNGYDEMTGQYFRNLMPSTILIQFHKDKRELFINVWKDTFNK